MTNHPRAGQAARPQDLIDVDRLRAAYHDVHPDPADPGQRVSFGTSGHRGTSMDGSFNEDHVLAITQAIVEHRRSAGIEGPLFLGKDTHALSGPAEDTALEVLAAHGIETIVAAGAGLAPTPVISREILAWNRACRRGTADGVVITPSHNPPGDGGFKYNPPHGGPAGSDVTAGIQARANALLATGLPGVPRVAAERARRAPTTHAEDFVASYLDDLPRVLDLDVLRASGIRIGIDPLGGSALPYAEALAERLALDARVVNPVLDPRFGFMTLDHDGKIRMDCSSAFAMRSLIGIKDDFDIAFGMDPDADRHGIVAPSSGLMNPNHYLAVAIRYLLGTRSGWPKAARVGKTLVSSGVIDRVVEGAGRKVYEVPVGFKWFAPGLASGELLFGGEESAGASFLDRAGGVWTTDKDGILLGLLAAEMTARTGKDPGVHYDEIADRWGRPAYLRVDQPATAEQKKRLSDLDASAVREDALAGEPIRHVRTRAPGNDAPIGGLKVETENAFFAARPSGTEDLYKIYAESFRGEAHLHRVLDAARALVERVLG